MVFLVLAHEFCNKVHCFLIAHLLRLILHWFFLNVILYSNHSAPSLLRAITFSQPTPYPLLPMVCIGLYFVNIMKQLTVCLAIITWILTTVCLRYYQKDCGLSSDLNNNFSFLFPHPSFLYIDLRTENFTMMVPKLP